ncbi:MAG: flagellar hook-associated protein FlgL [Myxococcota bacterium]|nr:flagellar hook-associated protein FlgL [Myxococcota bacterium]
MRITDRVTYRQAIYDITQIRSKLHELQRQGATGKKFNNIEADPTSAERVRVLREAKEATLHYEKNIVRSRTQLEAADAALDEASNILIRLKELALTSRNETINAEQRAIIAIEVEGLYDSMLGVANARAGGEYIFGGFLTDTRPFTDLGAFIGNDSVKEIDVGPSAQLAVNSSGADAFTVSGGVDIFGEIEAFRQALLTNDLNAVNTAIGSMEQGLTQVSTERTKSGLKLKQLEVAEAVRARLEDSLTTEESSLIDADSVEAFMDLNATVSALQAAINVSQKVAQTSLFG